MQAPCHERRGNIEGAGEVLELAVMSTLLHRLAKAEMTKEPS